jgi:copper(I)-binding protein
LFPFQKFASRRTDSAAIERRRADLGLPLLASFAALFVLLGGASGAAATIVAGSAWSRPAIETGVVYLTIANHGAGADRVVGASSPVARAVEMHETSETPMTMDGGSMKGMAMGGVSSMKRVPFVVVPPHGSVTFAPGGYHIMLIGLRRELHQNERFPLRLHFARAGWQSLTVAVRSM